MAGIISDARMSSCSTSTVPTPGTAQQQSIQLPPPQYTPLYLPPQHTVVWPASPPIVHSYSDPPPPYSLAFISPVGTITHIEPPNSVGTAIPQAQQNISQYNFELQKKASLFCFIFCLLMFNPLSVLFTLPAVICAVNAVDASSRNELQAARKNFLLSRLMMVIVAIQYLCAVFIIILLLFWKN